MARDFGASNEPGTCLWCGNKNRPIGGTQRGLTIKLNRIKRRASHGWGQEWAQKEASEAVEHYETYKNQYGHDGHFCCSSCAEMFGLAAARNGYRFSPARIDPPADYEAVTGAHK